MNNLLSANSNVSHEKFELDDSLIHDLIYGQNGTISTAIRELVTNAIDSGSPEINIEINNEIIKVTDNGKGFPDVDYIKRNFKRFGTPHIDDPARIGVYRIGRAQVMSFGVATWHSNQFMLTTDIQNRGYGYEMVEDENNRIKGCVVTTELYALLSAVEIREIKNSLKKLLKYSPHIVIFNGKQISRTDETSWDYDDEMISVKWDPVDAYGIRLFSDGIYVKDIDNVSYGVSADVVTKLPLKLNMARNEVTDSCPVWRHVRDVMKRRAIEKHNEEIKKGNFTEKSRVSYVRQIREGTAGVYVNLNIPLLRDCRGKKHRVGEVFDGEKIVTIADEDSLMADKIASRGMAIVLHPDECKVWDVESIDDIKNFLHSRLGKESDSMNELGELNSYDSRWLSEFIKGIYETKIICLDELKANFSEGTELLLNKDLSDKEKCALAAIKKANNVLVERLIMAGEKVNKRKIFIGESTVSQGWTDGETYIAIEREMAQGIHLGYSGAAKIATIMIHEYCHNISDISYHKHDYDFYEKYHRYTAMHEKVDVVGETIRLLMFGYMDNANVKDVPLTSHYKKMFGVRGLPNPEVKSDLPKAEESREIRFTSEPLEGKLTPLTKLLFGMIGAKITKDYVRVVITENQYRYSHLEKDLIENLYAHVKKKGADIRMPRDFDYCDDSTERWKCCKKHNQETVLVWAKNKGHNTEPIELLFETNSYDYKIILSILCVDNRDELVLVRKKDDWKITTITSHGTYTGGEFSYSPHRLKSKDELSEILLVNNGRKIIKGLSNPLDVESYTEKYFTKHAKALIHNPKL